MRPQLNNLGRSQYFVTICTVNRTEWFGQVLDNTMTLNDCGKIATQRWTWLVDQYGHIDLDAFVVMPNHLHGIVCIKDDVGDGLDRPCIISFRKLRI